MVTKSTDTNELLEEMKNMNLALAELIKQSNATDWKLWIIMNGMCDALLAQGLIDKDPRKSAK